MVVGRLVEAELLEDVLDVRLDRLLGLLAHLVSIEGGVIGPDATSA